MIYYPVRCGPILNLIYSIVKIALLSALPAANVLADPLTVSQFRELAPKKGEFEITGYIARSYQCPPCPKDAHCKPCMRDNVLMSEKKETLDFYPSEGAYLVVFTNNFSSSLTSGQPYRFRVKVLPSVTTSYEVHDLELKEVITNSTK